MKIKFLGLAVVLSLGLVSCGGGAKKDTVEAKEASTEKTEVKAKASTMEYAISVEESEVKWKGSKIVGDDHNGTIAIQEGKVMVADGKLTGGNFVIDMNSIVNLDIENEEYNQKLVGHLKADDFFNTAEFPTCNFDIVSVVEGKITGNLTLKGITKEISFPADISTGENVLKAHAEFAINRVDWGIEFNSGSVITDLAKDKIIKDEIEFVVDLFAKG